MKKDTPNSILLKHRLQQIGLMKSNGEAIPWTPEQIMGLCRRLRITTSDLGWMCAVNPREMRKYAGGKLQPPAPVCLHFYIISQWFLEQRFRSPTRPHFEDAKLHLMTG